MPRVIGVVTPDVAAAANARMAGSDLDPAGGDKTFTVGLKLASGGGTVAYWCSWWMPMAMVQSLRERLAEVGKFAEVLRAEKTTFVRDPTVKAYAFDAGDGGWQPDEVLSALNLVRV